MQVLPIQEICYARQDIIAKKAQLLLLPVIIIMSEKNQEQLKKLIVCLVNLVFIVFKVIQALMNVLKGTIVTVKMTLTL